MITDEIETMTNVEKLQAMDSLWSSLTKSDPEVTSPEWHGEILRERTKRMESGEAKYYSLEEVKEYFNSDA